MGVVDCSEEGMVEVTEVEVYVYSDIVMVVEVR